MSTWRYLEMLKPLDRNRVPAAPVALSNEESRWKAQASELRYFSTSKTKHLMTSKPPAQDQVYESSSISQSKSARLFAP
jgi:hypothetical protein